MVSVIFGIVGIIGTGVAVPYLEKTNPDRTAQHYWLLGIAGLFPAWLMAFLGLLRPVTQEAAETALPPAALFSSGAGLLGIIVTDYLLRRLQKSGRKLAPLTYCTFGWLALLPAWFIALAGL